MGRARGRRNESAAGALADDVGTALSLIMAGARIGTHRSGGPALTLIMMQLHRSNTANHYLLRRARLEQILPLRTQVLFAMHGPRHAHFMGDDHPLTRHYAAVVTDATTVEAAVAAGADDPAGPDANEGDSIVACLTLLPAPFEGEPAWQMRGVAVHPQHRSQGLGRALVAFAEREIADRPEFKRIWCNAVASAVLFYEKMGWEVVDEAYLIKGVGSHFKLLRHRDGG